MSERQHAVHAGLSQGAMQKAKTAERLAIPPAEEAKSLCASRIIRNDLERRRGLRLRFVYRPLAQACWWRKDG